MTDFYFNHRTEKVNREVKDVVAFHAGDFVRVSQTLQLDLHEPPVSQVMKEITALYTPLIKASLIYNQGWKKNVRREQKFYSQPKR